MTDKQPHAAQSAPDNSWTTTLRTHAETRRRDRQARWNEALIYYRQVTDMSLESSAFSKPLTLADLVTSVNEQQKQYTAFRGLSDEPLPVQKKKLRLWGSRQEEEQGRSKHDEATTGSSKETQNDPAADSQTSGSPSVKRNLIDMIKATYGPVELVGKMTVDTFGQAYPGVAYAFGSVFFLIKTARGVSELYDSIQEFFSLIKPFLDRLAVYSQGELSSELEDIITDVLIAIIRINGIAASIISHNRATQFFRVVIGKDERIKREIAAMRELFDNESRMVNAILLREFQAKLAKPAPVQQQASDPQRDIAARLATCKANLRPVTTKGAPENVLRSTETRQAEDTGAWVLSDHVFKAWLERKSAVLWMSGGPGVGKTFLACHIIRHLLRSVCRSDHQSSSTSVMYFFCNKDVRELHSVDSMLRTMAYQMCVANPLYVDHVESCSPHSTELDSDILWIKLFEDYFRAPPELPDYTSSEADLAYIVLDGLDEMDLKERRAFLKALNRYLKAKRKGATEMHMQFLLLGRPELTPEIESNFRNSLLNISITSQKNSPDIEKHVTESIDDGRLPDIDMSDSQMDSLIQMITQRANGMFLWADLMIEEMSMQDDFHAMQRALERAPSEMNGKILNTLEQMGQTLDEEQIADLNEMLKWATCAQRRLTVAELRLILNARQYNQARSGAIQEDYVDEMVQFEASLRKRYASWFTLIRDDGLSTEDLKDVLTQRHDFESMPGKDSKRMSARHKDRAISSRQAGTKPRMMSSPSTEVVIAHSSIKDYFLNEPKTTKVGVDVDEAHASIALFLLEMICDIGRSRGTLFPYACNQWQIHLELARFEHVANAKQARIGSLMVKLFHDPTISRRWIAQVQPFWGTWTLHENNQRRVQKWLAEPAFTEDLTESERAWAQEVHDSIGQLVRLPYEICAAEWLKKFDWMAPACFENVAAYMEMTSSLADGLEWPLLPVARHQNHAAHVRKVAQWTGFERDTVWHSRLGFCLRQLSHTEDAILEHEMALEEDPACLPSRAGLAYCFEDMGDLATAVKHMNEVLDRIEDESTGYPIPSMTAELYYNSMGEWQAKLDNQDAAIAAWEKLREQTRPSALAHTNLFNALYAQGKYTELIKLLEDLSSDSMPGQKHSTLTQLCLQWYTAGEGQLPYCPGIEHAAFQLGKIDIIRDMYVSAIEATECMGDMTWGLLLKIDLAQLLYRCYRADEEAMRMWKSIANAQHGEPGTFLHLPRTIASQRLQEVYVHQAATSQDLAHLTRLVEQFEDLIDLGKPESERSVHRNLDEDDPVDFAKLRLGALYTMQSRREDAMEALQGNLELGLDLIKQRRSLEGFECLLRVFICYRDDTHALAAFSRLSSDASASYELEICLKDENSTDAEPLSMEASDASEVANNDGSPNEDTTAQDKFALKLARVCDGCGFEASKPNGFYHCRVCTDTDWCRDCMLKLENGELHMFPPRRCDRQHQFLQVPDWEDKLEKENIRVGAEQWPLKRWIEHVKKEWSLP